MICIDQKTQVQAWTGPHQCCRFVPGLPEKATHDYVRHGTTNLFAALEVASEEATDTCYDRDTQAIETFIGG